MRLDQPPTVRQIYALAAALCVKTDLPWPETAPEASEAIGRLREDLGLPFAWLEDAPYRRRTRRTPRARLRDIELHEWALDELLGGR